MVKQVYLFTPKGFAQVVCSKFAQFCKETVIDKTGLCTRVNTPFTVVPKEYTREVFIFLWACEILFVLTVQKFEG